MISINNGSEILKYLLNDSFETISSAEKDNIINNISGALSFLEICLENSVITQKRIEMAKDKLENRIDKVLEYVDFSTTVDSEKSEDILAFQKAIKISKQDTEYVDSVRNVLVDFKKSISLFYKPRDVETDRVTRKRKEDLTIVLEQLLSIYLKYNGRFSYTSAVDLGGAEKAIKGRTVDYMVSIFKNFDELGYENVKSANIPGKIKHLV